MREHLRRGLRGAACLLVLGVIGALVALTGVQRMNGDPPWWVELSRYLPFYWLLLPALAALGLSFWLGRAWTLASLAALLLFAGVTMRPVWSSGEPASERVRMMTFNIKAGRAVKEQEGVPALGAEVARHDPDILVMQDADGPLVERGLAPMIGVPVFGLANTYALGQYVVASRFPILGCSPANIGYRDESHRYLRCTIEVRGSPLTVVTAHFLSPRNGLAATRLGGLDGTDEWRQNLSDRLEQSSALARDVAAMPRPLVVAGDLNAAEESPVVQRLLKAGLRDAFSAAGRGYGYTYGHAMRGLDFLRIDHILVSPDIAVADSFVGRGQASEHRPVIADLVLKRSSPAGTSP